MKKTVTDGAEQVIRVQRLVKEYRIYRRPADVLFELVTRRHRHTRFRALDGIGFDVQRGEVIGIIGRNGAGKSTLLKVLTGVVDYDEGEVAVAGRVSAILELGTGINPEYSGRDNILYGGMCRGMTKQEITEKFDEIIDFSELDEVIDQPFKTYSSGMQARLLFTIAMSVDSDVLIVDEALAAGDALFQEKCFSRMKNLASSGRTILFVSHSIALIQQLCTRGMLIDHGRLLVDGDTSLVLHEYDEILARARNRKTTCAPVYALGEPGETRADLKACLSEIDIIDENGESTTLLQNGNRYAVREVVTFNRSIGHAILGFRIHLPSGLVIYALQNTLRQHDIRGERGETLEVFFEFECRLQAGQYLLSGGVGEVTDASRGLYPAPFNEIHIRNNVRVFQVVTESVHGGLFDFDAQITTRSIGISPARASIDLPAGR
jgi:ABC-type polysaccharide/polyol phosphate transport system ATPase subunit